MAYSAVVVRVMIASPGDVEAERQAAMAVVNSWNAAHSANRGIVLLSVMWETHATAQYGRPAQDDINEHLTDLADIVVGIFWSRIGTPTSTQPSGSVEEVERHRGAGRPTLLYFSTAPVPREHDAAQLQAVRKYEESARQRGTPWQFQDVDDFAKQFSHHLAIEMGRSKFDIVQPKSSSETPVSEEKSLSEDAAMLLQQAAASPDGFIHRHGLGNGAGDIIAVNHHYFSRGNDPRSSARWIAALNELKSRGLVDILPNGKTARVTHAGYTSANAGITDAAAALLLGAANADGELIVSYLLDGMALNFDIQLIDSDVSAGREEAARRDAIRELTATQFLEEVEKDNYRLTSKGWDRAELLKRLESVP